MWFLLLLLVLPAWGEEKWTYVRSGPFEVWTDGGEHALRQRMVEAEQYRHALGTILGRDDLKSVWKIRILAVKDRKRGAMSQLHRVRDLWVMTVPADEPLPAEFRREAGRIFLDSNARAFPADIDQGLIELLVPLNVQGTRLHLGVPEERSPGWARVHLFVTDPVYAGRARVFFSTLESGGDIAVAGRNAFEKSPAELDKLVAAHLGEGDWPVASLPGRAMSDKDFAVRQVSPELAALARADIGEGSYKELTSPDAYESAGDPVKALEAGSKSATAAMAAASHEKDPARARPLLMKAIELNPLWGEPHAALARLDASTPARAMIEWRKAAQLDLRNVSYWQSCAEAATAANQFGEAAKGWNGALRATASDEERTRLRAARARLEEQRAEYVVSERQRERDDRTRDVERVKSEALAGIHEAEAKANARLNEGKAPVTGKVEEWWDGPGGPKQNVTGMLQRVDCGSKRLMLQAEDGKLVTLLVPDPAKVAILNSSREQTLGCGVQSPPRRVAIEFQPGGKPSAPGTVLTVEFK